MLSAEHLLRSEFSEISAFVFQDNFLKETWNNENNNSVPDAYQPVFLIALSSYREYNTYSDFMKAVQQKQKKQLHSYSLLSSQEEVLFTSINSTLCSAPKGA